MKKADSLYVGKKELDELEVPDLLGSQLVSYQAFLQESEPPLERKNQGLESVFRKIFPITNAKKTLQLDYSYYVLEPNNYSVSECKIIGLTYCSSLRISLRLLRKHKETGELIQARETKEGNEVFLGQMPLMTNRGTFIINGVERVVIARLQRSPGVYFKEEPGSPREYSARIVSRRGMWLEFRCDGGNTL